MRRARTSVQVCWNPGECGGTFGGTNRKSGGTCTTAGVSMGHICICSARSKPPFIKNERPPPPETCARKKSRDCSVSGLRGSDFWLPLPPLSLLTHAVPVSQGQPSNPRGVVFTLHEFPSNRSVSDAVALDFCPTPPRHQQAATYAPGRCISPPLHFSRRCERIEAVGLGQLSSKVFAAPCLVVFLSVANG